MPCLLFPGRHLLTTAFQERYLANALSLPIRELSLIGEQQWSDETIDRVIFPITSANQEHSRYNPLPFYIRAIGVDRLACSLNPTHPVTHQIVGIPHFPPSDRFAGITLKEIEAGLEGQVRLTPENTIILCSTPALIEQYRALGFSVLSAEYDIERKQYTEKAPIEVLTALMEHTGPACESPSYELLSRATRSLWESMTSIETHLKRIWHDPLLTESGSLTETRNYSTYAQAMDRREVMHMKYQDICAAIVPGKIVDEGCGDGALLTHIASDFPDSDLIGIELTNEFVARFKERQRAGEFGGNFVHVYQRNLLEPIFEDNSIDTTICNSTTHEIWSYGEQQGTLMRYLEHKFRQLRPGGRLLIRDVVGPEEKEQKVLVRLCETDGSNDGVFAWSDDQGENEHFLNQLSTKARFLRFAEDFLGDMRASGKRGDETKITFTEVEKEGEVYLRMSLKDVVEFMTKKDYTDNWYSELNEEFAFWSFSEWKRALRSLGFSIQENFDDSFCSRSYTNPWIAENRWSGKIELFTEGEGGIMPLEYPVTNMVLIARK